VPSEIGNELSLWWEWLPATLASRQDAAPTEKIAALFEVIEVKGFAQFIKRNDDVCIAIYFRYRSLRSRSFHLNRKGGCP
jgi:hypothetical protein